jgi:transcriptional regulator with XRE-family HTH domain
MTDTISIRDLREQKRLGQYTVAQACNLGFSAYVRIEAGSGKTTPEEVESVLRVLREMPEGTRKLGGGRPHNDPAKRAAVAAARERGESVAAALAQASAGAAPAEPAAAPESGPQDADGAVADEPAPASETKKERDARKARERRAAKKAADEAAAAASGLL